MERSISFLGLVVMLLIAWGLGRNRSRVNPRIVGAGLLLQFALAFLILKTPYGRVVFQALSDFFTAVLGFVADGAAFIFDGDQTAPLSNWNFAFGVLPTIIFFSSLMAILYHIGLMQLVVKAFALLMRKTLGTSGAETLSAAANVFVGQTEAPLVIRPFIGRMTLSELNVVMVGGFATIAGSVLAAYIAMGIDGSSLLAASVISAPAALMIAKIMVPETETPATQSADDSTEENSPEDDGRYANLLEAATAGASSGLKLALNVGAMLIVFTAMVAMVNAGLDLLGEGINSGLTKLSIKYQLPELSLQLLLGYIMAPFAYVMGVPMDECRTAGTILGEKTVLNEFIAYGTLAKTEGLSPRTVLILTYALCGFANFASIGIQLGGIGAIAPERRADLSRLALKAMIGGTLAAFMTACIASILLSDDDIDAMQADVAAAQVEAAE